jgi:hypothetical protein
MFKYAVDGLTMDPTGGTALGPYIALTPAALIAGYGAARAGSALFNELRNATFAKVHQVPCTAKATLDLTPDNAADAQFCSGNPIVALPWDCCGKR